MFFVEAILGLIAVVIGVLITVIWEVIRSLREEAQNLRAALRVVDLIDAFVADGTRGDVEKKACGSWAYAPSRPINGSLRRNILAARLASRDWDRLAENALVVEAVRSIAHHATPSRSTDSPPLLEEKHREVVQRGIEALTDSAKLLQTLHAQNPRYVGLVQWNYTERKRESRDAASAGG